MASAPGSSCDCNSRCDHGLRNFECAATISVFDVGDCCRFALIERVDSFTQCGKCAADSLVRLFGCGSTVVTGLFQTFVVALFRMPTGAACSAASVGFSAT